VQANADSLVCRWGGEVAAERVRRVGAVQGFAGVPRVVPMREEDATAQ
jgi:hypothetical protein